MAKGTSIAERASNAMLKTMEIAGVNFKIAKQVTFPLLKQKVDSAVYIRIDEKMFEGKPIKDATGKESRAELVIVTNLEDKRQYHYIVPAILKSVWHDEYADDAYVGKSFAIAKSKGPEGKRYNSLDILEIEPT